MSKEAKATYPNLAYFFQAYFHQDWEIVRSWNGAEPNFRLVVKEFKNGKFVEPVISNTIQELEKLINLNLDERDLDELLFQISPSLYAPGLGMTFQGWLEAVLEILKDDQA